MFTKTSKIIGDKQNLSNYISGIDIYNSYLLRKLFEPGIQKEKFEIDTNQFRPDLIAENYYGSADYMDLVILQAARGLENYIKGGILELIPKDIIDNILKNI